MRRLASALALALALPAAAGAPATPAAAVTPPTQAVAKPQEPAEKSGLVPTIKPQVEIVFAVDTTGSMGGLIDGAKRKIWAIANEVARAQQKPEVKIGLVAFRDRGDAYVTQTTPLTDNLDAVYETLMALRADGGGDTPEDVNAALTDAVHKMQWSEKKGTLKMIFLVGDAPPHMDYDQQQKWQKTAQEAIRKNIYINTVQCGSDGETTAVWKQIAHAAEGRYAAIPQDGGVRVAAVTPFDGELSKLANELDETNFTYGRETERKAKVATRAKAGEYAAAAPAAAAAERAVAKSSLGSGMRADEDMITLAETAGSASLALDKVATADLPDAFKGKSKEEQTKIVETNVAKRKAIKTKIAELSKKRDAALAAQAKAAPAPTDSFDSEVNAAMHAEGAKAGLSW
ncbi:MAG: VWA domain-containing protein [Deltaproteobacteria bacterium]|nr:VWA domain-containing protein [Deltaproteobacteria bacterium]